MPALAGLAETLPIHDHARYPFKVVVADAFDRLSVPLVRYYTADELRGWIASTGLVDGQVVRRYRNNESWRVFGRVPGPTGADRREPARRRGRPARIPAESRR